ncbi:MAG TPA: exo-beta-N-acetylmuramidase NamZ domain-containing protein, partial [Bacteroidales bacterium]|nr:exo-beta-N-acetylmuramidase NamZ domain-containing protein [Bacteroidales bacterium]
MKNCFFLFLFLFFQVAGLPQIRCGAERTSLYYSHLKHKNIAVVANAASIVGKVNVVDTLLHSGLKVEKIFCPEHGFRVFTDAGQSDKNLLDSATKLPVISLYGKKKKPDPADLKDI